MTQHFQGCHFQGLMPTVHTHSHVCTFTHTQTHNHIYSHSHASVHVYTYSDIHARTHAHAHRPESICLPSPHPRVPVAAPWTLPSAPFWALQASDIGSGVVQRRYESMDLDALPLGVLSHPGDLGQDFPCLSEKATQSLSLQDEWDTAGLHGLGFHSQSGLLTGRPGAGSGVPKLEGGVDVYVLCACILWLQAHKCGNASGCGCVCRWTRECFSNVYMYTYAPVGFMQCVCACARDGGLNRHFPRSKCWWIWFLVVTSLFGL